MLHACNTHELTSSNDLDSIQSTAHPERYVFLARFHCWTQNRVRRNVKTPTARRKVLLTTSIYFSLSSFFPLFVSQIVLLGFLP